MYAQHDKHTHTPTRIHIKINRREKGIQLIITFQMITLATHTHTLFHMHATKAATATTASEPYMHSNTLIFTNQRVNICY